MKKGGAARSRTANKSSTLPLLMEQNVDAPVPQITVELTKEIAVAAGGCANATDLGNIAAGVQIIPQEVHACVPVLSRK